MEKLQQLKPARLKLHESGKNIAELSPPLPGSGKAQSASHRFKILFHDSGLEFKV